MTQFTEYYKTRRERLMEQIAGGVALIDASGVAPDPNLHDRNLFYLTGYPGKEAYLLLVPEGVRVEHLETRGGPELMRGHLVRDILFVEERGEREAFMDGAGLSQSDIQTISGVDRVYDLSAMDAIVSRALMDAGILWLNAPGAPPLSASLSPYLTYINRLRERFHWVQFQNIASSIHQMRFVKDDYEVQYLREAFQIQTRIFERIMQTLKPGDNEALGQALFDYEVIRRGENISSMGVENYVASIIVGSGPNALIPHYMDNNREIQDGDLVLIDSGIMVNGYSADITRTFPANGRFTSRQRELYAIVLEAEYAAIETMKPGSTLWDAHQAVYDVFKRHNLAEYGYGNCAHPVGLSIHDPHARFHQDREQPFEPGVVLVIEPFLILPDEGIGIRIEDGVLITQDGHEVLAGPPREIDAVEALCARD